MKEFLNKDFIREDMFQALKHNAPPKVSQPKWPLSKVLPEVLAYSEN